MTQSVTVFAVEPYEGSTDDARCLHCSQPLTDERIWRIVYRTDDGERQALAHSECAVRYAGSRQLNPRVWSQVTTGRMG